MSFRDPRHCAPKASLWSKRAKVHQRSPVSWRSSCLLSIGQGYLTISFPASSRRKVLSSAGQSTKSMTLHTRQSLHESKDARQTSNDREAQLFFQSCQMRPPVDGRPSGRSERKNCPMSVFSPNATPQVAIGRAGFPCTTVIGRTDDDTTLPAVTTAPRPIVTFGSIIGTRAYECVVLDRDSLRSAEVGNQHCADTDHYVVPDGDQIRARCIQQHLISYPNVLTDLHAAPAMKSHSQ